MPAKRKAIPKRLRFEVFKRDFFTCQYCGAKAPDVLLEVDHLKPVSKGGKNDIVNLVTSCCDCNRGKSDKELSDNSVVEKQRAQVEILAERRAQLKMLMEWHNAEKAEDDYEINTFTEYMNKAWGISVSLTKTGILSIRKSIQQFGMKAVLQAVDTVAAKYSDEETGEKFKKIAAVLYYENASEDERQVMYIRGVCRNRFGYWDSQQGTAIIRDALEGWKYEYLLEIAKTAKNWTSWKSKMIDLINATDDENE